MTIETILKECYWDSRITKHEINAIIEKGTMREKQKLFSKIIYNSKDKLKAIMLFDMNDYLELFDNFKVTYNHEYINKHLLVLRSILLNEIHYIKSLEWRKW